MDENSGEPELYPLDPDVGMAPEPEAVEETVTGDVDPAGELGTEGLGEDEDGNPVTQAEGRPAPLDAWSDEDPEFVDLLSLEEAEAQDDEPEADLPVEAPEEELEDEDLTVPADGAARWVQYELWGRNVSLGEGWTLYATADFAGGIEAEVDDLTAGTNLQLRIRLVDNLGRFSKWSAAIQVSLPSDFTPPPEPTAPSVSDNNGIIVTRWDGQLMGETPADMSHVLHYVQQMHPAGNPDGPAGDPQLISEFRRQGRHTSGAFADRVEHRAWFSAVDTTGNESPRSEYAYFTPSAPVDAQRINDELASISDRVGSGFDQSLTDAIEDIDSSIDQLVVGELFVPGAIKAVSIDVQDLAVDEARMNQLWVGLAEIAEAQIDNLLGNTAKFKVINAPFIQSHTAENVGWKLRPTGEFEVYGANDLAGEPQIKVGASAAAGDLITLRDEEGNPSVSMNSSGGLSAIHLSSDDDPHFGGKAFAGRHFNTARWNVVDNALEHGPLGVLKHYRHNFNGRVDNASASQNGMAVMHLEERIRPGRLYRIRCDDFEMGNRASYWMEAFYTMSDDPNVRPDVPTQLASEPTVWMPRIPGRVPVSADSTGTVLSYDKVIDNSSAVWLRVIFSVGNTTGVANTFGSSFRHSAHFTLEDIGPSTGQKGYPLNRGIRTRDEVGPELAEDLSVTYPTVDTATYTLNTSTGVATRQYLGGEPRFGRWSNGTYYMTLARQASWSTQPGVRSGAQFQLAVDSWLNPGRGHIVQQGIPTFDGFPASFNYETQVIGMPGQLNVPRWSPRLVTPEGSALSTLLGKEQAMIAVGRTGYSSLTEGLPASGRLGSANTNARLATEI